MVRGEAEQADGEYVTGDFFRGLSVSPAAGRMISSTTIASGRHRVVVISVGYSQRRFGDAANAVGQPMLIDNVPLPWWAWLLQSSSASIRARIRTCIMPMRAKALFDPNTAGVYLEQNFYWLQMMGRLRPGVCLAQAQAALAAPFAQWVTQPRPTTSNAPIFRSFG